MADAPAGEWLLMVDGASRGNPGEAGCGAAIFNPEGEIVRELSRYLGKATNNVAEYAGLLMGLEEAIKLGVKKLRVESDSELLVRQLSGIYKVREPRLIELHGKAQALLRRFESHRIRHVPREQNRIADKLANRGIDEARGKN